MEIFNSETVAKALKGGGLSSKQKISKALKAWNDNTFFFPNKDEFLLTWICSCFAKPNTKKWLQDNRRAVPFIQINMLAPVSLLLQEIYSPKSSIASDQKKEFLVLTASCIKLLFSASFSTSYRPAFENVSAVTEEILKSLEIQISILQNRTDESKESLKNLISIAQLIMLKFESQLVLAANQKKVIFFF
ncbi:hypothetical protein BY458DRAFT_438511 [Sporodiniella umbellata]|nr:hypothetical protein BY458DRAFT_438511 [Sporodiniella umbellata]